MNEPNLTKREFIDLAIKELNHAKSATNLEAIQGLIVSAVSLLEKAKEAPLS
jgi:hypothetical protein